MEFIENLKLGAIEGVSAGIVYLSLIVTAVAVLLVLIVNAVNVIKEHRDALEDGEEDKFYAEYGITGEELRLNKKITDLREKMRSKRRIKKDLENSIRKQLEEEAAEEAAKAPKHELSRYAFFYELELEDEQPAVAEPQSVEETFEEAPLDLVKEETSLFDGFIQEESAAEEYVLEEEAAEEEPAFAEEFAEFEPMSEETEPALGEEQPAEESEPTYEEEFIEFETADAEEIAALEVAPEEQQPTEENIAEEEQPAPEEEFIDFETVGEDEIVNLEPISEEQPAEETEYFEEEQPVGVGDEQLAELEPIPEEHPTEESIAEKEQVAEEQPAEETAADAMPEPEPEPKVEDWSKYEGHFDGTYYDPEDACYYEGEPPEELVEILALKRQEWEAAQKKDKKKVVVKKVVAPFLSLKTPKHDRTAPEAYTGAFDESIIYGKYVIEHAPNIETGEEEYYYTLYAPWDTLLYSSSNYSSLEYCRRAIVRFQTHVLVGEFSVVSMDRKYAFVLSRKTYVHAGDPQKTYDAAAKLISKIKSYAHTDIIREQ